MFSNYIMPLGFLQFDNEPEGISKQLDEDLKIINGDLPPPPEVINPSVSPFVTEPKRKPAFKPPPVNEDIEEVSKKEFEKWIKNMDKFEKMMIAMEKEKQREMEKLLKVEQKEKQKELDLENKIRQKIKREQKQEQDVKYNKPTYQNISTQPILQQPTNDYGEYSNMFGY